jgi:hypothetical protein
MVSFVKIADGCSNMQRVLLNWILPLMVISSLVIWIGQHTVQTFYLFWFFSTVFSIRITFMVYFKSCNRWCASSYSKKTNVELVLSGLLSFIPGANIFSTLFILVIDDLSTPLWRWLEAPVRDDEIY